jgi:hypothetical protein
MNYTAIVPVLVNAIQEQQTQIDSQEQQILTLEARLSALERAQNSNKPLAGVLSISNYTWLFSILGCVLLVFIAQKRIRNRS